VSAKPWPKCGARTRGGGECGQPAVHAWPGKSYDRPRNGRCRFHGGLSTGPRTPEGRRRVGDAARARYRAWIYADAERRGEQARRELEAQGYPDVEKHGREVAAAIIAEYERDEAEIARLMADGITRARARYLMRGGAERVAELRRLRRRGWRWW
jgi:hypothetical protein